MECRLSTILLYYKYVCRIVKFRLDLVDSSTCEYIIDLIYGDIERLLVVEYYSRCFSCIIKLSQEPSYLTTYLYCYGDKHIYSIYKFLKYSIVRLEHKGKKEKSKLAKFLVGGTKYLSLKNRDYSCFVPLKLIDALNKISYLEIRMMRDLVR